MAWFIFLISTTVLEKNVIQRNPIRYLILSSIWKKYTYLQIKKKDSGFTYVATMCLYNETSLL